MIRRPRMLQFVRRVDEAELQGNVRMCSRVTSNGHLGSRRTDQGVLFDIEPPAKPGVVAQRHRAARDM